MDECIIRHIDRRFQYIMRATKATKLCLPARNTVETFVLMSIRDRKPDTHTNVSLKTIVNKKDTAIVVLKLKTAGIYIQIGWHDRDPGIREGSCVITRFFSESARVHRKHR